MPRLIDADKLEPSEMYTGDGFTQIVYMDDIDEMPTVDAVEVVRCDDCIYRDGNTPGQPNILCWQMHADDFCSYGTKREVGTYCEDIVSVVRCKDCEFYDKDEKWCRRLGLCGAFDENGFCSHGERKEDD